MDTDSRVALAEIRGDVKLVLMGQERMNSDLHELKVTVHGHGNRIMKLEGANILRDGEKKGLTVSAKVAWGVVGLALGSGGITAIVELLK